MRNAQLQLARERAVLQKALEMIHGLTSAIRTLVRSYELTETNFNRLIAARVNVEAVRAAYETDTVTLDLLLDAQRRLAVATSDYFRSLVDYNLAVRTVHYRKGSLAGIQQRVPGRRPVARQGLLRRPQACSRA